MNVGDTLFYAVCRHTTEIEVIKLTVTKVSKSGRFQVTTKPGPWAYVSGGPWHTLGQNNLFATFEEATAAAVEICVRRIKRLKDEISQLGQCRADLMKALNS